MKLVKLVALCASVSVLSISLGACATAEIDKTPIVDNNHNSRNSLDWEGAYRGVIPCADCSGIDTVFILKADGTYINQYRYKEKDPKVYSESGKFTWSEDGDSITFDGRKAKIAENKLIFLDEDGKQIGGVLADNYVLTKVGDANLTETYWKLTELMGQPVKPSTNGAYMILKSDGKIIGSSGCNRMMGSYETKEMGNAKDIGRIKFSQMAGTMMACVDGMDTEREFLDILGKADSYSLNGDTLQLNRARMAPLAKFEAVYLY